MLGSIAELNGLPRDAFAEAVKPILEAARPLADPLYERRPFTSYDELIACAEQITTSFDESEKIAVLQAHPRIGESAAVLRQTSPLSASEQGREDPEVDAALKHLNAEYEQRFGFRFVVFVNRRPRSAILEVLRQRMHNAREQELQMGLAEMFRIARDRLQNLNTAAL